jgi:hypothetical protein
MTDPNISKATTGKERVVAACAESQSTSRAPNRTRFVEVQAAIRAKMQCDKKALLAEADASKKRNLILVGGYADNAVDLCGEGSADAKRQCLGKGQTMLTKPPSQAEFEECGSEAIIKNGLSPSLLDDPLFRKALVTTARLGQSAVLDFAKVLDFAAILAANLVKIYSSMSASAVLAREAFPPCPTHLPTTRHSTSLSVAVTKSS